MKLICPICKEELNKIENSYKCQNKHSFDVASSGYLNLNIKNSNNSGDEKEMIRARHEFLNKDYYLFLRNKLNEVIDKYKPNSLLDLACGEGYYTKSFSVEDKIGIDLSKEALKKASKQDKTTFYILKNIFEVPFENESFEAITTIFAPISKEIPRLLKKNGHFILVKPDIDHLYKLKETVYDSPYLNEVKEIQIDGLKLIDEIKIKEIKHLNKEDVISLFKMTPYYHKTSLNDFNKLNSIETLDIEFSFIIDIYEKF